MINRCVSHDTRVFTRANHVTNTLWTVRGGLWHANMPINAYIQNVNYTKTHRFSRSELRPEIGFVTFSHFLLEKAGRE